jgi:hypothetical protein
MRGRELQALVHVGCLLGVEKVGRDWVTLEEEKNEGGGKNRGEVLEGGDGRI